MAQAKFRIQLAEDPVVRQQCRGIADQNALARCADHVYLHGPRTSLSGESRREHIKKLLDAMPDTLPAPSESQAMAQPAAPPSGDRPATQNTATEGAAKPAQDNEIFCSFVAYRIHSGDIAYSRAELVPPECRGRAEIREALEDFQRRQPPISMHTEDRDFISNVANELREQLPPME